MTNLATGGKLRAAFVTFGAIGNSYITTPLQNGDNKFYGISLHPLAVKFNLSLSKTAFVFQSAALLISNFSRLVNIWTGMVTPKGFGGAKGKGMVAIRH